MVQAQIAERAKGLLGILESPPEFGTPPGAPPDAAAGDVPRRGTVIDVPRSSPADPPPPGSL